MTEIARELLEDISQNDYIQVRYGTNSNQETYEGTVMKWSENFLTLEREDGEIIRIRLDDNMRTLKKLANNLKEKEREDDIPVDKISVSCGSLTADSVGGQVLREMVALQPQKPCSVESRNCLENAKKLLKRIENVALKKVINGILNSLETAIKNREVSYKYHNLRTKVISAGDKCENVDDYELLCFTLGILALMAGDYVYALEPFVRIGQYSMAAYAASCGKLEKSAQVFSLCALLSEESTDVNQYISEICVSRREGDTLRTLLEKYKNNQDMCEKLASCALALFSESGGRLAENITPNTSAYDAAKLLLDAVPDEWRQGCSALYWWEKFSAYLYPKHLEMSSDENYTGYIRSFCEGENYGFISPNYYFYISQVLNNSEQGILLRKMLSLGHWRNLEVRFRLGKSVTKDGKMACMAIELTEKGYKDALGRMEERTGTALAKRGFVEEFFPEYQNGRIQSNGVRYHFLISAVVDPWLKAYYMNSFSPKVQDVTFKARGNKAFQVCWLNPDENEREAFADFVQPDDVERWEMFLGIRAMQSQKKLPEQDPFEDYPYQELEHLERIKPEFVLTWGGKALIESETERRGQTTSEIGRESAIMKLSGTSSSLISKGRTYAEHARIAAKEGRLEDAEQHFQAALWTDGFNEAVVCDYISLCMRRDTTIDKALQLIREYEKQFQPEKLLNLKIQVYDKKKDYVTLCPLYEEAFKTATTVSKKSHQLLRLINAYMKQKKYSDALDACKRWEQLFAQNKFSSDAEKLKHSESNIHRYKAVCLYHMGRTDDAKKIATELVRVNPADQTANRILDETLVSGDSSDFAEYASSSQDEFGMDDFESVVAEGAESQMSRFVRTAVQQTDIAVNLKTPNIRDGRYIGTSKAGLDDVKKLASGRRISLKTRSDSLFAACKIFEQIEQRGDGTILSPYYKYRLTGRAMASWGDFMVSQVNQLDTTRMAYLYALRILIPAENGVEQDWTNSYNRYIKSFFLARIGSNSLDEYINQQTNSRAKDGANTDIFVDGRIPDVLISDFVVGILMLVEAIGNQREQMNTFVEEVYSRNLELKNAVCRQLQLLVGKDVSADVDCSEFKSILLQAVNVRTKKINELHGILTEISRVILSRSLSDDVLFRLNAENWKKYITATDSARLSRLCYMGNRLQDYFYSSDFENRSDCLRAVILEAKDLLLTIQKEPTDVSYDLFLPALEQIILKMTDKQTNLYQDFLPKLSWRETIQPFRTPDGQIQIQLTVENEVNYQTADALSIVNVTGNDIEWFDKGTNVQTLRGGDEVELGILVTVSEFANAAGSFTATINYTYKCNDAPQNVIIKDQEIDFTFIIRDEHFESFINPYSAYEGKVMDNENMFVGRSSQIQQIVDMICPEEGGTMNYGRAIAMYGQTRTGKSSLMYHLKKRLLERYQDDILIWDMGNIGELPESDKYMVNFVYNLLAVGDDALIDNAVIRNIIEECGLASPLEEILQAPDLAMAIFNKYMKDLDVVLRREQKIIVLFIDEFTYLHGKIKEGKIPADFMRFWKALLQNYCIFAIVAGQDDMPEFMREYQNEFACMELLKLNYIDERDAKLLVQKPLEDVNHRHGLFRNDGSIHLLYSLTAGSAYLIIILCSKLVSYLNEKGAYTITKGIVDEFLRTRAFGPNGFLTEIHFEAQLQERGHGELNEVNKSILLSVARLSQTTGYADISDIECDGIDREEIRVYVDRLVDRNVLVKEGRSQYWIQVRLLERWLINSMGE